MLRVVDRVLRVVDEIALPLDLFKRISGTPQLGPDGWRLGSGDNIRVELERAIAGDRTLAVSFDLEMRGGAIASYEVLELARGRGDCIAASSHTSSSLAPVLVRRSLKADARLVLKVAGGGNSVAQLVGVYLRRLKGAG